MPTIKNINSINKVYITNNLNQKITAQIVGRKGTDGTDGLSAYEIAVNSGFVGTEEQWLESLQGTDGTDGVGIPIGGNTGQVLSKINEENYNTEWIDPPSGSPDGTDGDIQYNNSGNFSGASKAGVDSDGSLLISDYTINNYEDTTISSPNLKSKLFIMKNAFKRMIGFKTSDEITYLQPGFYNKKISYLTPLNSGLVSAVSSYNGFGFTGINIDGGQKSILSPSYVAGKELYYGITKASFQNGSNPTNVSTQQGFGINPNCYWIGTQFSGGFFVSISGGFSSSVDPTNKFFMGLTNTFTGIPNLSTFYSNSSSVASGFGIGWDQADSLIYFISQTNNGTPPNKIPLTSFSGNLTSQDYNARILENIFKLDMYIKPGGTTLYIQFKNLNTNNVGYYSLPLSSGKFLPSTSSSAFYRPFVLSQQGQTGRAFADTVDFFGFYGERDY